MTTDAAALKLAGKPDRPLLRVLVYYVFLFGTAAAIVSLAPEALIYLNAPPPTSALFSGGPGPGVVSTAPLGQASGPLRVVIATVVSLATACALMLPVTWVYVQTRRKKGFDQSVVQTLIILPLVVAGVILLVQNSTALAFSLGGIVGAVSFRNTLRDTKDAIYIFLAIVVGVAAGVHAMLVAATISVCFNLVTVIMWWNNFGRTGAPLEGAPARDRLAQAKAIANRTEGFISMVDRELLRSMSPEQLQALTERARARQQKAEAKAGLGPSPDLVRDRVLRIAVGADPGARAAAEGALANTAKRYEFVSEEAVGDGLAIVYQVRLKKSSSAPEFLNRLHAAAGGVVQKAELVD